MIPVQKKWTAEEWIEAKRLAALGYSAADISAVLPGRSRCAVIGRFYRESKKRKAARKRTSDQEIEYLRSRIRRLPQVIEDAELKLLRLYAEAKEYRMYDILHSPAASDEAWDREIALAKLEATYG